MEEEAESKAQQYAAQTPAYCGQLFYELPRCGCQSNQRHLQPVAPDAPTTTTTFNLDAGGMP